MDKSRSIENDLRKTLMATCDRWVKETGFSRATLSRRMHGSDDFLEQFKRGKVSVTIKKYQDMSNWLLDPSNWTPRAPAKSSGKTAAA